MNLVTKAENGLLIVGEGVVTNMPSLPFANTTKMMSQRQKALMCTYTILSRYFSARVPGRRIPRMKDAIISFHRWDCSQLSQVNLMCDLKVLTVESCFLFEG